VATIGPFATASEALAAVNDPDTATDSLLVGLFPYFVCPGCSVNETGCAKEIMVITSLDYHVSIIVYGESYLGRIYFDAGSVSASCSSCVDAS